MPRSTHAGQLTAGEPAPAEVVEPRALPGGVQLVQAGRWSSRVPPGRAPGPALARPRARAVNPSSASTRSPGADAPKRSIDTKSSAHRSQPERRTPASTDRVGTSGGRTSSCTSSVCSSSRSQHGSEVTWAWTPSAASSSAAATRDVHLAARGDEHDVGILGGPQHVRAPGEAHAGGALEHGQVLAREDQRGGSVVLDGEAPGLGGLVGVGGPDHAQPGDGAQRGDVLDRLVGGPVLADARPSRG